MGEFQGAVTTGGLPTSSPGIAFLCLPAPPPHLGSAREGQRGQGHPEPPRPPTPYGLSREAQGPAATELEPEMLSGNFGRTVRLRWASDDSLRDPLPKLLREGNGVLQRGRDLPKVIQEVVGRIRPPSALALTVSA